RGPGHAAKLADELPNCDVAAIDDVGRHVATKAAWVVPMSRCRPRRQPFAPVWIRRLDVDLALAVPRHLKAQMRVEPSIRLGETQKVILAVLDAAHLIMPIVSQCWWQVHRDLGSPHHGRWPPCVRDLRL